MSAETKAVPFWTMIAVAITLPPGVLGQTVRGTLLESGTSRPVSVALITLVDMELENVDWAETDAAGRFELTGPEPGDYYVRAQRQGYQTRTEGILELGADGEITVEFYLRPAPIELEGIDVVADRDWVELRERRRLENAGFYHRKKHLVGQFITPEEIEEKNPFGLVDLFRGQLGVTVVDNMNGRGIFLTRGITCPAAVYVDGIRVHELFTVQALDVAAVEIYRGMARIPIEYGGLGDGCGVVLFWTK